MATTLRFSGANLFIKIPTENAHILSPQADKALERYIFQGIWVLSVKERATTETPSVSHVISASRSLWVLPVKERVSTEKPSASHVLSHLWVGMFALLELMLLLSSSFFKENMNDYWPQKI